MSIKGLDMDGLDTLIRAAFLRPVHIVRQFKPHSETNHYSPIAPYHRYIGLSIALKNQGIKRISDIPIGITNLIWRYA